MRLLFIILTLPHALTLAEAAEAPASPKPPDDPPPQLSVFDAPAAQVRRTLATLKYLQLAKAKKLAEAEAFLAKMVQAPHLDTAVNHYNLACAQALQGKADAALASLAKAVDRGWIDVKHLQEDPDLDSLRALPRFEEIVQAAEAKAKSRARPEASKAMAKDGVATVTETNTYWLARVQQFAVLHEFPPPDPAKPITTMNGPVGDLLREWQKEGTAAGLHGFLYDNRDRGHSRMNTRQFPQITRLEYSEPARKRAFDHGVQHRFLHNAPTIGNSSTAVVRGAIWASQTRFALRQPAIARALPNQYQNNHLYFYPEHRDHDADGHGDVFHANVPYVITSQGSSGSDRPFMQAVACILAAFPPDTQRELIRTNLLMPTVQMVFRSHRKPVVDPSDYLTGKAHPPVFASDSIDLERMVRAAHAVRPNTIPPVVRLQVVEEDAAQVGVDYFEARSTETVFTTPSAISRIARASRWERRMVVSVEETKDPNNRPLTFRWVLLQGDPDRVHIKALNEQGTRAEIRVAWHERRPVAPGSKLLTTRVDVGVFANNGTHPSAPAFICWYFPANEKRVYDDARRIQSIERLSPKSKEHYTDPGLVTPALWRDDYHYDAKGNLLGWTRTRGKETEEFTRHGALVTRKDGKGRPTEARSVRYMRQQKKPEEWPVLLQEPGPEILTYTYKSDDDPLGTVTRRKADSN
jgi:hypothetical protein